MKFRMGFIVVLTLIDIVCHSQSKPAGPVIATPNATAFGIYGETPVSYFTGLPDIQVPIYILKERGLEFPLKLSYYAQGFRPDIHPSWVGENWSLNLGGVITRKVNKLPDEWYCDDYFTYGFYFTHNRLSSYNWNSNDTLISMGENSNLSLLKLDRTDREPDEFDFSFLGYSGKFFLDAGGKWRVQCNKNIRVVFDNADLIYPFFHNTVPSPANLSAFKPKIFGRFTLIDDAGIQYIFGKTALTDGVEYSSSITPPGFNYRVWLIATSWYLAEIRFPDGAGSLSINYERGPFQSSFQYFESQNRFYVRRCDQPAAVNAKGLSGSITLPVYPYRISTSSGITIDFKYSRSNELSYPAGTYLEVFRDEQGRLPSQQTPQQGIDPYYFSFMNARGDIPYYVANGIWPDGVISNNKFAWFKLDSVVVSNYDLNNGMAKTAFRCIILNYRENVSERLKLMSVMIKGSVGNESEDYSFQYNDYGPSAPVYATDLTDHWGFANNKPLKRDPTYGGYIWFGGNMNYNREPDEAATRINVLTSVTYPTGGKTSFEYESNDYGKYLLTTTRAYAPAGSGKAGGLRIRKLTNSDGLGNVETREFFYVNNYDPAQPLTSLSSSGVLDGRPSSTHYNYSVSMNGSYMSLYSSNGIVPLSGNSGAICGYSEVAEKFRDGSYRVFRFTNHDNGYADLDAVANITPYELGVPYRSRAFERGYILSEDQYSPAHVLVQRTERTYLRIGSGSDTNFVRSLRKDFGGYCTNVTNQNPYVGTSTMGFAIPMMNGYIVDPMSFVPVYTTSTAYGFFTYKFLPEKITVKAYPTSDIARQPLITETTNQYDGTGNLVQTLQNDSKGNGLFTSFKYPADFRGSPVYDSMLRRNMSGIVIESSISRGGNLVTRQHIDYAFFNGNTLIKPYSVSKQVGNNPPFISARLNRYDDYGNLLEMQGEDGIKTCYVWSYFKSRPVAKVLGVSFSMIEPLINPQILTYPSSGDQQLLAEVDKIRTNLSSAMVTTYLYDAKADWQLKLSKDVNGLATFYEYDKLGRLSRSRDNAGRIIKQFEYKTKQAYSFPYVNVEKSQAFTKTDCAYGYAGSALFTVVAGKYGSFVSQLDADQKALDDIASNGQVFANTNAVCYPFWQYVSCCGFSTVYSSFSLTGSAAVNFSIIVTKTQAGGGAGILMGNLSGPLFLPTTTRSINFSSTAGSGMIQIAPNGQVKLYGSIGNGALQITGNYSL